MDPAWIAIGVTLLIALAALVFGYSKKDSTDHERLAKLETKVDRLEAEVKSLRERWHDLRDNTLKDAWKLFEEWKDQMYAHFRRDRDHDDRS